MIDRHERMQTGGGHRVGDVAALSGVSVRMLRHYDRLGLLRPSSRTSGGHREYSAEDVTRLEWIVGLRALGFSLEDIGSLIDEVADPAEMVAQQLDAIERAVSELRLAKAQLEVIAARLARAESVSALEFFDAARTIAGATRPMSPDQVKAAGRSRRKLLAEMGAEEQARATQRRREVMDSLAPDDLEVLTRHRSLVMPSLPEEGSHDAQ